MRYINIMIFMKYKERAAYKHDRIRALYIRQHGTIDDIVTTLNQDPEFKRICGSISYASVQQHLAKIKREFEYSISDDAIEKYTAEYVRKMEFMDQEISNITEMLKNPNLKDDHRLKLMRFRHDVVKDEIEMLTNRELPLSIKKMNLEKQKQLQRLKTVDDPDEEMKKLPSLEKLGESNGD